MSDSNETRTALLENNYKIMNDNIKELSKKVDNLVEKFDRLPESLDNRFADKDTEIVVKKLQWLVISTVILALLGLVIFKQ
jgi:predicted transcriptional regulator